MILSLHAIEWFQLFACKSLLINVINIYNITNHHNLEQRAARTAYVKKNCNTPKIKSVYICSDPNTKHFCTSKPVFINMSPGVDLSVRQWWSVTKYNYFVTVLKYIFQVSVLYWSSFILSNFYFYFTTFQSIRSYFLLHYIS